MTRPAASLTGWEIPVDSVLVLFNRPLRPGTDKSTLSRFGDMRWNFSPAIFEDHLPAAGLNFEFCPKQYLAAAKIYVWTLLNTEDPVPLRRSGGVGRLSPLTLTFLGRKLFPFFDFLQARNVVSLAAVTADDYDDYLTMVTDAKVSLALREGRITEVRRLWSYRHQLPYPHAVGDAPPWDGDDTKVLVGAREDSGENMTRRIDPDTMNALLLWALRYVDDFADDIVTAWNEHLVLSMRNPGRSAPRGRQAGGLQREIPDFLQKLRDRGDGLPGKRDEKSGLQLDLAHLSRMLDCSANNLRPGMVSRRLLDESGLRLEDGAPLEAAVQGTVDGEPWLSERIKDSEVRLHARMLTTACYVVIAYLSGMRPGEVLTLRRGCAGHDPATGLWLLGGRTWKSVRDTDGNKIPQGESRSDPWVVIPVVARAVAVLERLHNHELLFPGSLERQERPTLSGKSRQSNEIRRDLNEFVAEVNAYCERGGRADAIPAEHDPLALSGSRFRRTLAWHIYRRPRGLVAGTIQYGHVHTKMFLGYAGDYSSGFADELAMEEFLGRLETLSDDVAALDASEHVSGPAAVAYRERTRNGHERFAGKVLRSKQQARSLLANPSLQVFPGHGMTCVFDRLKAKCATESDEQTGKVTPRLDDCRPNCGNLARTDRDIAVVKGDITRLEAVVAEPLSPPIRHHRERRVLESYREIVEKHEANRPKQRSDEEA